EGAEGETAGNGGGGQMDDKGTARQHGDDSRFDHAWSIGNFRAKAAGAASPPWQRPAGGARFGAAVVSTVPAAGIGLGSPGSTNAGIASKAPSRIAAGTAINRPAAIKPHRTNTIVR